MLLDDALQAMLDEWFESEAIEEDESPCFVEMDSRCHKSTGDVIVAQASLSSPRARVYICIAKE